MIETKNLILDKAKFSDWKEMYENVWSRPESARYMAWKVTTTQEDAKLRIMRTIEFQNNHDVYIVYEKQSGKAIGFAGVDKITPFVYQETGICLGPDYVGKGFGTQILEALIQYCKQEFDAKKFFYSTRKENEASNRLAKKFGFTLVSSEKKIDNRNGQVYEVLKYNLDYSFPSMR